MEHPSPQESRRNMFPTDPISVRQLVDAELLVAQEHRHVKVVSQRTPRWRTVFDSVMARRHAGPLPATHELFDGLSRKQLARAAGFFTVAEVPAGQSLGQQGSIVDRFVTVLEGKVGVTIDGVPHAVLDDGSQLNGLSLLDDEHPTCRASFNVMVPSRIASVEAAQFAMMLEQFPKVADRIRAIADVRRAYLAGLAAAADGETPPARWIEVEEYPVHLANVPGTRRHGAVTRGRTHSSR